MKFHPIGTVVLLSGGTKPLMIYGRRQIHGDSKKLWDYVACLYPEGNISPEYNVFFQHVEIEKVLYFGYITSSEEEIEPKLHMHVNMSV